MAKKVEIGDIVEVPTKLGNAYVQFSHYHESSPPKLGAVIRLLPGSFPERPSEFQALANKKEVFYTLFPLQAAINQNIFSVVGHADLPAFTKPFPLFRSGMINPASGKIEQWWLWDGTKSWKIDGLTDSQLDLPIKSGWNDTLLISRIEQGWTPRYADAFVQAARQRRTTEANPKAVGIRHFLLFSVRSAADCATRDLIERGFDASILDNGHGFTVVVRQGFPSTPEYVEHVTVELTATAHKFGGKYDAWETQFCDPSNSKGGSLST